MKKIKKLQENGFYIFTGQSNANSCFIEKIIHARKFLVYANYFLLNYISIYDYLITKNGWTLLVKIKYKKNNEINELDEVWRVISERMRLFLSTFVRVTNKQKGRTGCLVHSSYERYYFESKKEAMCYIAKIRNQKIKHYSKRKKYRGLKTHYKISINKIKGSIFLCSKEVRRKKTKMMDFVEVLELNSLRDLVVEKFVDYTINSHFPIITPNPT